MPRAIAVCDSTALIGLARPGHLKLLSTLFERVLIPPAVLREVTRQPGKPGAAEVLAALGKWLVVRPVQSVPPPPRPVGDGEWEAILLFEEEARAAGNGLELVLDELRGRKLAASRGLSPVGLVGLLLAARQRGLLPEIRPTLDALRDSGFRLSDALYKHALAAAGELQP